jgi:hypothetical protein
MDSNLILIWFVYKYFSVFRLFLGYTKHVWVFGNWGSFTKTPIEITLFCQISAMEPKLRRSRNGLSQVSYWIFVGFMDFRRFFPLFRVFRNGFSQVLPFRTIFLNLRKSIIHVKIHYGTHESLFLIIDNTICDIIDNTIICIGDFSEAIRTFLIINWQFESLLLYMKYSYIKHYKTTLYCHTLIWCLGLPHVVHLFILSSDVFSYFAYHLSTYTSKNKTPLIFAK